MKRFAIALMAAILVAGAQTRDEAARLLKAAQNAELVDGNLNSAIKQYGAIVGKYAKSDRGVAATALVRMAECYQKMGNQESRKLYEQVVREYSDQKDAVTMARARLGTPAASGRQTATLVWSGPKADQEGTVSPDGRYISFPDWETGDLGIHEIATGENRRLTDTHQKGAAQWSVFAEESAISRDGKQVAYSWFDRNNGDRYELRLANLTGEPKPRRLYDSPKVSWLAPRDWSPDGKQIAVLIALEDGSDQLGLVSVADGSLRVLKSGQWRGDTRIFFSPDGRFLGYDLPQGDAGPERDVFVMTVDGAREIPAVVHRGRDIMMGWSLDGKRLLFASDRTGAQSLWSVAFVDGKPQGDPVLIKADIGEAESLGVTRAGALYYGLVPGRPTSSLQIATFDFATGKLLNPRDITQDYLESNSEPNWSPDGKLLAYVSTRGRGWASNALLVIRSAETLQVIRELRPKLRSYNLTGWAPDGQSLLAQGRDSDGRGGAFRIDAQTAAVSSLVLDGIHARLTYPAWSPDGKSLYFSRRLDNDVAFFKREIASGAEKEVIRRPALGAVNLSPDGRYIATGSSEPSTNSRLMLLIPVDGGESRVVMRVPSGVPASELENRRKGQNVSGVVWAPDNRSFLTFKSVEGSNEREMWQVPVDGGAPHKLATTRPLQAFRVQPGGQQIAYAVSDPAPPPTSEIWALENFVTSAIPNK